jgi:hypothetical protein
MLKRFSGFAVSTLWITLASTWSTGVSKDSGMIDGLAARGIEQRESCGQGEYCRRLRDTIANVGFASGPGVLSLRAQMCDPGCGSALHRWRARVGRCGFRAGSSVAVIWGSGIETTAQLLACRRGSWMKVDVRLAGVAVASGGYLLAYSWEGVECATVGIKSSILELLS